VHPGIGSVVCLSVCLRDALEQCPSVDTSPAVCWTGENAFDVGPEVDDPGGRHWPRVWQQTRSAPQPDCLDAPTSEFGGFSKT
jgi:hypothetical protein